MAAVAVQIRGTLYDLTRRTSQQVVLMGEASLLGLGIGGGPIIPPEGGAPGAPGAPVDPGYGYPEKPVDPGYGIPGPPYPRPPSDAHPEHPIYMPGPHPEHPIVIPEPPTQPPEGGGPEGPVKPPPADGGWGYWHPYGWAYVPGSGQAGPKG